VAQGGLVGGECFEQIGVDGALGMVAQGGVGQGERQVWKPALRRWVRFAGLQCKGRGYAPPPPLRRGGHREAGGRRPAGEGDYLGWEKYTIRGGGFQDGR